MPGRGRSSSRSSASYYPARKYGKLAASIGALGSSGLAALYGATTNVASSVGRRLSRAASLPPTPGYTPRRGAPVRAQSLPPRGRSMSRVSSRYRGRSRVRFGNGVLGGVKTTRKRKVHRNMSNENARILAKGVYMTTERSVLQTSDNCVYIGHVTNPVLQTQQIVAMAIIKAIFVDLGVVVNNFNDQVEATVTADKLYLQFRADREPGTAITTSTGITVFGVSYFSLADALATTLQSMTEQAELIGIYFYPDPATSLLPFRKWSFTNTKLEIIAKSTLKFQNRSVNETGDEDENDVDNVPLIGRSYSGKGTGTEFNNGTLGVKPFFADRFGLINKDGDTEGMKEPPFGQLFPRVKKQGKITIEPGSIKISTLVHKQKMLINSFLRQHDVTNYASIYPAGTLGKFEFFGVEKIIGGLSAQEIQVAAEQNLLIGCICKLGKPKFTTEVFVATTASPETV